MENAHKKNVNKKYEAGKVDNVRCVNLTLRAIVPMNTFIIKRNLRASHNGIYKVLYIQILTRRGNKIGHRIG